MQSVDRRYLDALSGSVSPVYQVDAYYDGSLVMQGVPIQQGSVTLDRSRAIEGAASLTAASPDDTLVPNSWSAPLAPFGSELHIRAGHRTGAGSLEMLSLGWYRIDSADPDEWWDLYYDTQNPAAEPTPVCRGVKVEVDASDRMGRIDEARFLAPEAPESLASVLAEIKRLARDLVPISDLTGVVDAPIPASIAYQQSRTQAIQDLAGVLDMTARIDANGALALDSRTPDTDPVWTVEVGRNGQIVGWRRKLDRTGLYNAVVSSGTTPEGLAVQASRTEDSGPLRWGGPMGRIPYGHSSPLITSELAASSDAATRLDRLISQRVVPVTVRCVANHALRLDDPIAIKLPDVTYVGTLWSITWPIPSAEMTLVVQVPRSQLWR